MQKPESGERGDEEVQEAIDHLAAEEELESDKRRRRRRDGVEAAEASGRDFGGDVELHLRQRVAQKSRE